LSSLFFIYFVGDELEIHILEDTLSTDDSQCNDIDDEKNVNSSRDKESTSTFSQQTQRNLSDTVNNSTHTDNNNNNYNGGDDVVDVNNIKKAYNKKSNDGDDEMMMMMTSRKDDIGGMTGRKRYQLHKLFFSLPKH
jgi:hypothetical protein